MATTGSKLRTKEAQYLSGMTELNHLGAARVAAPHVFADKFAVMFSSQNHYGDSPLMSQLSASKLTSKTIGSTEWEWQMKVANSKPLVIVRNITASSNITPGKYRRTFKIVVNENWYKKGSVLTPGTSDKRYQVRVMADAVRNGDGWEYLVKLNTEDDNLFMPVKHIKVGAQWTELYATYGEASKRGNSLHISTPIALKGKLTKYRKEHSITDFASNQVLLAGIPDSDGKIHNSWLSLVEAEFFKSWYKELERGLWYSRSTDTVMDENGRPVQSGAGIHELLEDSHREPYTHLTAKFIEEYIMDIFYSRTTPGSGSRQLKAFTGEYGMLVFHRAIMDEMSKKGFIKNVEVYTDKVGSSVHKNALEYGYQFVRYNMANGASLELVHNPLYDDRSINFEIDPITGKPVESQRFTFLDFTSSNGMGDNIKIIKKEKSDLFNYVYGLHSPYGPTPQGKAAHSGDWYEMHAEAVQGVQIDDITKCGELYLKRA